MGIDWEQILINLAQLLIAYVLAFPIGWNREHASRGAGLRTFPLVAVGSCGYVLIGLQVLEGSESYARVLYGLMTGIGFIGGGAILKDGGTVTGTANAASIWITGAVGAAVAWGIYEIAVVLSLLNWVTFYVVTKVKTAMHKHDH